MDDRGYMLKIGDQEYEMLLTMKVTKAIAKDFGDLEKIGEEIQKIGNQDEAFNKVFGIVLLLVNGAVERHNFANKENPKPFVTQEELEMFVTIFDLKNCFVAILGAVGKGTTRNIKSAESEKKLKPSKQ